MSHRAVKNKSVEKQDICFYSKLTGTRDLHLIHDVIQEDAIHQVHIIQTAIFKCRHLKLNCSIFNLKVKVQDW